MATCSEYRLQAISNNSRNRKSPYKAHNNIKTELSFIDSNDNYYKSKAAQNKFNINPLHIDALIKKEERIGRK